MRKWALLGLLFGLAAATGCATVTRTSQQNLAAQRRATDLGWRQMADDWNLIWMTDRQSRLTRWQTR